MNLPLWLTAAAVVTFAERKNLRLDAKRVIAQKGAELIEPGQVVMIDGGTTTTELMLTPFIAKGISVIKA